MAAAKWTDKGHIVGARLFVPKPKVDTNYTIPRVIILEDLGMRMNDYNNIKQRWALIECPYCGRQYEVQMWRAKKQYSCLQCAYDARQERLQHGYGRPDSSRR